MTGRVRSRRRSRTRLEALTGAERTNLTVGRGVACDWSEAERRACWEAVGDDLAGSVGPMRRPAAWWQYRPGIPDELREDVPRDRKALLSVLGMSGREPWPTPDLAVYRAQERRRAAFLVTGGHLLPGEQDYIRQAAADPRHPDHDTMLPLWADLR